MEEVSKESAIYLSITHEDDIVVAFVVIQNKLI
jgi:phosphopantetheinyl transferase (holo-ACP synthase)